MLVLSVKLGFFSSSFHTCHVGSKPLSRHSWSGFKTELKKYQNGTENHQVSRSAINLKISSFIRFCVAGELNGLPFTIQNFIKNVWEACCLFGVC